MTGLSDIKRELSKIQQLERELNLKQVQVNRLLSITQAINNNTSAKELYQMYQSFLSYEMGIKKMALYIQTDNGWTCTTKIGISDKALDNDIEPLLPKYKSLDRLNDSKHPFIKQFDVVIPVSHKDLSIAYVFLGGFKEDDDMYDKVQFITAMTNVIAVAIENKRLFKQQIRQERLKREMELASAMQLSMVPKHLPSKDCYQLASIYKPHLSVGGDYFDFMEFGDGKIIFCVGDISGKGLAAALLMANFQAIFHTLVNNRADLIQFVKDVNIALFRITGGDRFITFFVAEYDMNTRKLTYVNAGHNPPVLVQGGKALQLTKGTTILGCFDELPFLETGEVTIEKEATVLVYTDGLTDIQDENGNYLGMDFLEEFVPKHAHLTAKEFNEVLVNMTEAFVGDEQDYPDDFTVLTCKLFTPEQICA
ncbi:MAG: PP2C family protein-serine/threonine phosphatase [Bacteroidota bacterium]